jgi:hypothetical protein
MNGSPMLFFPADEWQSIARMNGILYKMPKQNFSDGFV